MSRSPILSALALVLVLPLSVSAQTPTPSPVPQDALSIELADPAGDLQTDGGEIVPGPGFMDLTSFSIRVDQEDLLVTLEVAGDLAELLSTSLRPDYSLLVTVPGTSQFEWFHVIPGEDWSVARQLDIWQREPIGRAQATGSRIAYRVPRPRWVDPQKLRFFAVMGASYLRGVDEDLPDVRDQEGSRRDGSPRRFVPPTPAPTDTPLIELEWSGLYDTVPDSASEAAAWVAFDGEVTQNEELEPLRSPLVSAATTKLILRQRTRDMRSPTTLPELRERIQGFYEAHGETVATMPAFDGIGRLGDETMFDELLGLMRTGDTKLVEPEDQRRSRLNAAAGARPPSSTSPSAPATRTSGRQQARLLMASTTSR